MNLKVKGGKTMHFKSERLTKVVLNSIERAGMEKIEVTEKTPLGETLFTSNDVSMFGDYLIMRTGLSVDLSDEDNVARLDYDMDKDLFIVKEFYNRHDSKEASNQWIEEVMSALSV